MEHCSSSEANNLPKSIKQKEKTKKSRIIREILNNHCLAILKVRSENVYSDAKVSGKHSHQATTTLAKIQTQYLATICLCNVYRLPSHQLRTHANQRMKYSVTKGKQLSSSQLAIWIRQGFLLYHQQCLSVKFGIPQFQLEYLLSESRAEYLQSKWVG